MNKFVIAAALFGLGVVVGELHNYQHWSCREAENLTIQAAERFDEQEKKIKELRSFFGNQLGELWDRTRATEALLGKTPHCPGGECAGGQASQAEPKVVIEWIDGGTGKAVTVTDLPPIPSNPDIKPMPPGGPQ